jgi:hypothetical protein
MDRSIDFGGHPNPHAMIGSMNINKDDDEQLTSMSELDPENETVG